MATTNKVHAVCEEGSVMYNATHSPAAATDAVVTITPGASQFVVIWKIYAGYSATPPAATCSLVTTGLIATRSVATVPGPAAASAELDVDLAVEGMQEICGPYYGDPGTAVVTTLESGGGTIVGTLNVRYSLHDIS